MNAQEIPFPINEFIDSIFLKNPNYSPSTALAAFVPPTSKYPLCYQHRLPTYLVCTECIKSICYNCLIEHPNHPHKMIYFDTASRNFNTGYATNPQTNHMIGQLLKAKEELSYKQAGPEKSMQVEIFVGRKGYQNIINPQD